MTNYEGATQLGLAGLAPEEMPSLADFADEPTSGAWPKGWYRATVIEGYSTKGGRQYATEDTLSKAGDSHNLWLCFAVTNKGGETRQMRSLQNYKPAYFTADYLNQVRAGREANAGARGKWTIMPEFQPASIAIGHLGQVEKAFGFRFVRHPHGHLLPTQFVGKPVDVYLGVDERGYNEITQYASPGSKAK